MFLKFYDYILNFSSVFVYAYAYVCSVKGIGFFSPTGVKLMFENV